MSQHLLELSFGPVQSFIASARRSRDLWAGSYMLSEIARAAGMALIGHGAELIYPAIGRVQQDNPDEDSNLSNILLARLPEGTAPHAIAEVAIAAGKQWLADQSVEAIKKWNQAGVALRQNLWQLQIDDAIEAYAAWASLDDDTGYRNAYDRLKATFAARKNTRDFGPLRLPSPELGRVPKNSFDGLRESVLPETMPARARRRFGLSQGEQLDALGAIKRVLGKKERFTALSRLAAHDWLTSLDPDQRQTLTKVYAPLVDLDLATRASHPAFRDFPYDGGLLYPERLAREKASAQDDADALAALDDLERALKTLWRQHGRPNPYAALVVADGDKMGAFVDQAKSAQDHAGITRAVAAFADRVPLIASEHAGQSVFNGGEDLTVMLPLSQVIAGSRALAESFDQAMADVARRLLGERYAAERPTLRVGVALCHVLEPLGVIRHRANAAEKFAKGEEGGNRQGNALGLVLHIRAGHEIGVRIRFDDPDGFAALAEWQQAYAQGEFPGRLAYDTRAIALDSHARGLPPGVGAAEFKRLLDRARERGGEKSIPDPRRAVLEQRAGRLRDTADDPTGLMRLAGELILARWLSAKTARDLSSTGETA